MVTETDGAKHRGFPGSAADVCSVSSHPIPQLTRRQKVIRGTQERHGVKAGEGIQDMFLKETTEATVQVALGILGSEAVQGSRKPLLPIKPTLSLPSSKDSLELWCPSQK